MYFLIKVPIYILMRKFVADLMNGMKIGLDNGEIIEGLPSDKKFKE